MKSLTFKQWYSIALLVVLIIFGWIYLTENRYILNQNGDVFDTWNKSYTPIGEIMYPNY